MRKVERLVNLVALLLDTHRPLTLDQVAELVPGYEATGESLRRMFERDKEELRGLGVPIERGPVDPWGSEEGYFIDRKAYAMPRLELAPDERAALALAARAWSGAAGDPAALAGLAKLDLDPGAGPDALRAGPPARDLVRGRARQRPRRDALVPPVPHPVGRPPGQADRSRARVRGAGVVRRRRRAADRGRAGRLADRDRAGGRGRRPPGRAPRRQARGRSRPGRSRDPAHADRRPGGLRGLGDRQRRRGGGAGGAARAGPPPPDRPARADRGHGRRPRGHAGGAAVSRRGPGSAEGVPR